MNLPVHRPSNSNYKIWTKDFNIIATNYYINIVKYLPDFKLCSEPHESNVYGLFMLG